MMPGSPTIFSSTSAPQCAVAGCYHPAATVVTDPQNTATRLQRTSPANILRRHIRAGCDQRFHHLEPTEIPNSSTIRRVIASTICGGDSLDVHILC